MCLCFVFSAGLGVGGVFLLALNFPPKTRARGRLRSAPRDEGAGRGEKSFLPQVPGLAHGDAERGQGERERARSGSALPTPGSAHLPPCDPGPLSPPSQSYHHPLSDPGQVALPLNGLPGKPWDAW